MARTADRRNDLRRKKQHRALKPNKAPASELSSKSRRWRTGVLVLSVILFIAGVLIVVVPLATMATMVPAPLLIFGVICLLLSLGLPMVWLCRGPRDLPDLQTKPEKSTDLQPTSTSTGEKVNLSFESEQQQMGCLQTTPKIFRFSRKQPDRYQDRQAIPMVATKQLITADNGNKMENSREISTVRKIEIRYENENDPTTSEKLNLGFVPDSSDKEQDDVVKKNIKHIKEAVTSGHTEKIKKTSGNTRFSFNIRRSSPKDKRKFSNKKGNQSEEVSYVNKSFQNDLVQDPGSQASGQVTKEVDVDSELSGMGETQDKQQDMISTSQNFISKKMFDSFKSNAKKKSKTGKDFPTGKTNFIQLPLEQQSSDKIETEEGTKPPVITLTPPSPPSPDQGTCPPPSQGGGKQILLKNNFTKTKDKVKKHSKKEPKQKKLNHSSTKNNKQSNAFNGKISKSTKYNDKPMKRMDQNTQKDTVIVEYENETRKEPNRTAKDTIESNGNNSTSRGKGFKKKSPGVSAPVIEDNETPSRISGALKLFKPEKGKKGKKDKTPSPRLESADLMMTEESVKDKYITTNYGPRDLEEKQDSDSPPVVHFGNIPQDVDLIGMRIKNAKDTRKPEQSNLDEEDEGEEGKFSDILKFISRKEKGKVMKNKKASSSSKKSCDQPKSRSIDQINRMLLDIADSKCPDAGTEDLPQPDQKLLERSLLVNFNPGGLKRHGGSMESFDDSSSVGSTGSYRSTGSSGSIMYPVRSSLKKSRNKDTLSAGSSHSKKSVTYAIGSEQTTV